MWDLLPQKAKAENCGSTLGTIGSTLAAHPAAAAHLAQSWGAPPRIVGYTSFQEVAVSGHTPNSVKPLGRNRPKVVEREKWQQQNR